VTVNSTNLWQNISETTTGVEWAPPCPAVQRLRDCVYRLQRRFTPEITQTPSRTERPATSQVEAGSGYCPSRI
jgi:hypothetical protein